MPNPKFDAALARWEVLCEKNDAASTLHVVGRLLDYYQLGEELAGPGIAQTEANLALFLAEHNRKLPESITIAESVAATRHDIFTQDALAWAYYKTGRLDKALAASRRALRTGTHDERILSHAAAIRAAL